jgi:hypothetical protein
MLHGLFGRALRKVGCAEAPRCAGACARPGECGYSRLFDPPRREPAPHRLLEGVAEPPGPVVLLVPPPGGAELSHGATMSLGLRLLGEAREDHLVVLERALAGLAELPVSSEEGRVEPWTISRASPREIIVRASDERGASRESDDGDEPEKTAQEPAVARAQRATVRFETPVRLKQGGRPMEAGKLDFAALFSHVWRRLTMVCSLFGEYGAADDAQFQALRPKAEGVRTVQRRLKEMRWEHLSVETGERKPMRGLLGEVVFEGEELPAFSAALAAGEVVHLGGGASFGLGRMRVSVE